MTEPERQELKDIATILVGIEIHLNGLNTGEYGMQHAKTEITKILEKVKKRMKELHG